MIRGNLGMVSHCSTTTQRLAQSNVLLNNFGDCCSLNELPAEPSEIMGSSGTPNEQQLPRACNVAFNSLPTIHINEQIAPQEVRSMQNQLLFSSDSGGRMLLKSYPKTIACEESMGLYASKDFLMSQQTCHQRKYFAPHWSVESVNEALEKGNVFKALFRVNAHNRLEAYCKINGVQTDVLISGIAAQNRAVVHVVKSDSRLANNDLPVDIQRLLLHLEGMECTECWSSSSSSCERQS
ncbi:unnamed protein product [Camellia sinensis]